MEGRGPEGVTVTPECRCRAQVHRPGSRRWARTVTPNTCMWPCTPRAPFLLFYCYYHVLVGSDGGPEGGPTGARLSHTPHRRADTWVPFNGLDSVKSDRREAGTWTRGHGDQERQRRTKILFPVFQVDSFPPRGGAQTAVGRAGNRLMRPSLRGSRVPRLLEVTHKRPLSYGCC